MRKHLVKDFLLRKSFLKNELIQIVFKSLAVNKYIPKGRRNSLYHLLSCNKSYFVRIRNFCIITGRGRGILHSFKISRHCFKKYASNGFIEGISKSSW